MRWTRTVAGGCTTDVPLGLLPVAAMLLVQLGVAASTPMFDVLGPAGTGWLRLCWAAAILLVVVRPRIRSIPPSSLAAAGVLGAMTAGMTLLFMQAVDRIPMGTASALEFLGPLTVAVVRGRGLARLLWPPLAALGVLALTEPWTGDVDALGIAYALCAACMWAGYIVLTQHVGDRIEGLGGLAISFTSAAIVATIVVGPAAYDRVTPSALMVCLGLAILLPVLPLSFELIALRRITAAAFGTMMSLEPAIALLVGVIVLGQGAEPLQLGGLLVVVLAGVGAERGGRRPARDDALAEANVAQ